MLVLSVLSNVAHPDGVCSHYPLVTEVLHASYSVHKLAANFAPQLVDQFLAAFSIARAVQP